jgi:hypothetical protein
MQYIYIHIYVAENRWTACEKVSISFLVTVTETKASPLAESFAVWETSLEGITPSFCVCKES